jgi:hypothetical protein
MIEVKFMKLKGVSSTLNDEGEAKVRIVFEDTVPLETANDIVHKLAPIIGAVVDVEARPIQQELFKPAA